MYLRRIFSICALLALVVLGASSQTIVPATSSRTWNTYVPSYIPDGFSTIIGNGGTLFPNSGNTYTYPNGGYFTELVYSYSLPFPFRFINTDYAANTTLQVSTNGYLSFPNSSSVGSSSGTSLSYYSYYGYYYLSGPSTLGTYPPINSKCIFGYVGSNATNIPSGDGGVYYKVEGAAGDRILTIEWRATDDYNYYSDGSIGNHQVKMYERTSNIEFHFGPNSLNRGYYFYQTSLVGIKDQGEYYYYTGSTAPTNDTRNTPEAQRYFLFNNPSYGSDTIAITGMRIFWYGTYGYTEYYPMYYVNTATRSYTQDTNRVQQAWHNSFPTSKTGHERIAYRLSPVLNDVASDSLWFSPTVTADAYSPGATVTASARFRNLGGNPRLNVPVRADLYFNGNTKIATVTSTAFANSTAQFGTALATFPSFSSTLLTQTGVYEVRVYPQLSTDQDPANDTTKKVFYISRQNDIMPYAILQPFQNVAPLYSKYPVGVGVPIEVRFLNIGTLPQTNVRVGYQIFDINSNVVASATAIVNGTWGPISYRDVNFSPWTPSTPGSYFIRAISYLAGDEQPNNDTLPKAPAIGKQFEVRYEIEISADNASPAGNGPLPNSSFPIGKPIGTFATFVNSGVSDATNVPVRMQIRDAAGTLVYDRTVTVLQIIGDGGRTTQQFPSFIPQASGTYCVTAWSNYAQEPVRSNDTVRYCFNVKPALSGVIRVGFGERYRTIREARDSLFLYGVGGPLTFELVDDNYTVTQTEATTPSLDFRGRVVGLGVNNPVLWKPVAGKTSVTVNLKSGSGIGMWYGQLDTSNPSGYITWDGGAGRVLHFVYENTGTDNRAIPFFFGQGSSNNAIKNVSIEPVSGGGKLTATTLSMPSYNATFNQFTYSTDLSIQTSAGIMLRNAVPIDQTTGANTGNRDTLRNQNNVFDNNVIRGFAYGIASVGAGPLWNVRDARYEEFLNQNNSYTNNTIEDVGRGGVVVAFEKGSQIIGNTVRRVVNNSATVSHAAGIAATAGANTTNNRGYSTDLRIERNKISTVTARVGNAAAISVETNENVYLSPTSQTVRLPLNGATNMQIRNNMAWDYSGGTTTVGIGLTQEATSRIDFVTSGNRIENNTLFNQISNPTTVENGIYVQRAGTTVKNNIIALVSPSGSTAATYGLAIIAPNYKTTVSSDYNLLYVPGGYIGYVTNLSSNGYQIPSQPAAKTLQQWRSLTGLDMNSVSGDVTSEFVSVTPGSVDLHINANVVGSLASNRGVAISGLSDDIDGDPRASTTRPDIGADEFSGRARNYDVMAEDVLAPGGYRAATGQYSDAEYQMVAAGPVSLTGQVRNVGGQPFLQNTVTLVIERKVGAGWVTVSNQQVNAAVDVASTKSLSFGTFTPQTLGQIGQNDAFYGTNPNVTPIYRFTLSSGTDDNAGNNTFSKEVRFYVERSDRAILVSVRNFQTTMPTTATGIADKLNTDSLVSGLNQISWSRADGVGAEDYDLFERDKWPTTSLNFLPWKTLIWSQGELTGGIPSDDRVAIKALLNSGDLYTRKNLLIAGQEIARIHDVALTATNGQVADQDFVRNYLRAEYRGATTPANYSGLRIRGVRINPGKYELVRATGVVGDTDPLPSALRVTAGQGIAAASHSYVDQTAGGADTVAGVAATGAVYNAVFYAQDWRHFGRFAFEPEKSGVRRMLLGGLDYVDQFRGALPVKLVKFDAYQSGRTAVTLEWKTASEVEIAAMEIERAQITRTETGVVEGSFATVDRTSPAGTTTSGADYRVVDGSVSVGGEYRYRLVTVNLDGTRNVEESRVVKVLGADAEQYGLTVLPNPVRTSGSISWTVPAGTAVRVVLYDATGREASVLVERSAGSGVVSLPVAELSSGVYTARLESATGVQLVAKVTVQK